MELDELKFIWKSTSIEQGDQHWISTSVVNKMIHGRSHTTISNIKRNLRFKLLMAGSSGVLGMFLAGYHLFLTPEQSLILNELLTVPEAGILTLILSTLLLGITWANYIHYRHIVAFEASSQPLRNCLLAIRAIIHRVINLVLYSDLIVSPLVAGFFGYLILYQRAGFSWDLRFMYLIVIIAATGMVGFVINKWILHRRFGKDLVRLNECLDELKILKEGMDE